MATTVNNSTLTTTTSDRLILNGVTYGSTTTLEQSNSDEVYNRIMTIPAYRDTNGVMQQDFVSIVSATDAPNSAGDVDINYFQYARITNLDDTYPLWIKITDDTSSANVNACYVVRVPKGSSYIAYKPEFFATNRDINAQTVESARTYNRAFVVSAIADKNTGTDGIDIEVFVVTK